MRSSVQVCSSIVKNGKVAVLRASRSQAPKCLCFAERMRNQDNERTGKQYKAHNDTADDASGVLECLGTVRVSIQHGHLL